MAHYYNVAYWKILPWLAYLPPDIGIVANAPLTER